jgi:hypothetical protein
MPKHSCCSTKYTRARAKPRIMSITRVAQRVYSGDSHVPIMLRMNTRRFLPPLLACALPPLPPSRMTRVENKKDDVRFVDEFVQHADIMPPQLFLRLGGRRRRLGRRRHEAVT